MHEPTYSLIMGRRSMDTSALIHGFLSSPEGQRATGALNAHGLVTSEAHRLLGHAAEAAALHGVGVTPVRVAEVLAEKGGVDPATATALAAAATPFLAGWLKQRSA
jgi:hypothetical protein